MGSVPALLAATVAAAAIATAPAPLAESPVHISQVAPLAAPPNAPAARELPAPGSPGCGTRAEYDRIKTFMRPATVSDILGPNGSPVSTPDPDVFARGYDACWTNQRRIVVWYDDQSGFSIRWDVRDL